MYDHVFREVSRLTGGPPPDTFLSDWDAALQEVAEATWPQARHRGC